MFSMITFIKTTKVCKINLLVEKRKSNPEFEFILLTKIN